MAGDAGKGTATKVAGGNSNFDGTRPVFAFQLFSSSKCRFAGLNEALGVSQSNSTTTSTYSLAAGGARGGGRGGFTRDVGPPDQVLGEQPFPLFLLLLFHSLISPTEMGTFIHAVEGEMLCSSSISDKVPYFNAPIYLQNKSQIGKVDEILGPINEVYFSVKMENGVIASSFKKGDKVYIGGDKLLPLERFLPKPKVAGGAYYHTRFIRSI